MKKIIYIILGLFLGGALTAYAVPSSTIINSVGGIFTTGSVLFGGNSNEITQDNANLYYDDTNNYLGIGSTTPSGRFAVTGAGTGTGRLIVIGDSANAERLTIFDNGKVGIGTSSPSVQLLNIQGGTAASTGNIGIRINNAQTTFSGAAQTEYQAFGTSTIFAVGLNNNASGANALDAFLMQQDSNDLYFGTNNVERVRIMSTGEFGVGTTSGSARLAVKGAGTGTGRLLALSDSSSVERIVVLDNGKMGIATSGPWTTLSGSGTLAWSGLTAVSATQNTVCITAGKEIQENAASSCLVSAARYKKNIRSLSSGISDIMKLRPVGFQDNAEGKQHRGFLADEIIQIIPSAGYYAKDGRINSYEPTEILATAVKSIQELIARIVGLEARMAMQEARIKALELKIK